MTSDLHTRPLFRTRPCLVSRLIALGYCVCVATTTPAATIDWSATATTTAWSLGTNWDGLAAPANDLTTDIARFDKTSYVSQPNSGTRSISGIQIGDGTTATATLTLTNTALSIGSNGITMFANAGAATLTGGSVKLGANQSWTNNSSNLLTISSAVTNIGNTTPFTLTINGSGSAGTTIGGVISNGGTTGTTALTINTTGGTTTLSGANTYTGGTTLTAGNLKLSGSGTLGGTSGALTINGGTLDLNGTNQGVGNFTGSGGTILNNSTGTNVTLTIGNGNGTGGNYSGVIADHTSGTGTVALTKTGTGTITLSGANTYTRATTVSAGILNIQNATALGTTANGTSVTSGATLQIQGGITVGAEALTLNGSGASGQNGALVNVSGTNNYGGLITLGSASTISSNSGTLNLTNTGTITGATFGLTLTGSGDGTISSIIGTTTGGLTKSGTGTWTLTGANTYTGPTTVNGGNLSTGTFTISSTGPVSIASGATYTSTGVLNLTADTTAAQTLISGAGTLALRSTSSSVASPDIYYDPNGGTGSGYQVTIASNVDVGTGTRFINGKSNRNDYERYGGDLVFSGNLSGSANVTFTGTPNTGGTNPPYQVAYTLAGNNSGFTGGVTLTDGANLTLNNTNALTSANSVTFTPSAGAVAGLYLYGRNITIGALSGTTAGTMNIRNGSLVTDTNTTINPGIVRSNSILTVQQDSNTTFNGIISDGPNDHGTGDSGTYYTLGLTKAGTGSLTLGGSNTYTGATAINAGTISVSSLANGGSGSNIGASTSAASNLVLNGGTLQYTGAAVSTNRLFSVGTSGGTLDASGSGAVNFSNTGAMGFNSQTGTRTLTLTGTNSGSNTLSAVIGDNGGATSVVKNGTGNWVLGSANTYTGTTTVNAGDLSTGTFTLSTTATLAIASGATYTSTGTLNLNPDTTAAQTFISGAGTLRLRNSSSTASAPDIYWNPTGSSTSGACYPVTIASNIDVGTGSRYFNGISNRNDYERFGGDLIFSGNLTGSANLTFTGTPNTGLAGGPWQMAYTLAGDDSGFSGGITLTNGVNMTLNNVNALTSANSVTFTPGSGAVAGLYLYGRDVTIGALSGTSAGTMNIRNGSLVTDNNGIINPGIVRSNSVLTVQQNTNTTFNGIMSDGPNDYGAGAAGTYYTLGLIKSGTGTLTLGGANTYTGGTTINGGILALGSDSGGTQSTAANSLGTGAITIDSGAQLRFGGSPGAVVSYTFSNNITLNNGSIVVADGAQHLQGAITVGSGGGTLTTQYLGKDLYLDGAVSGSGALTIDNLAPANFGDGQVHFTGTNSYSGTLTVSASGSGSHGGKISVDSNNALASATIAMNGPRDINFATTAPVFGALSGTGGITLTSGLNLSEGNNNTASTYSGSLTGAGSLTKIGSAAWSLTGANTYSGTTTVNAGSLFVNGSTASGSAVTVNNSGTTLGGSGTIGGSVNVASSGANLSPGATGTSSNAILHTGALTLATGSNLNIGINGTTAGTTYDQVSVTGTVNLGGTLASNLVVTTGATLAVNNKFFILLNDGVDSVTGTFAQGTTVTDNLGDTFLINYADNGDGGALGNDVSLTCLSVVPEPSTWTVGTLGTLALVWMQFRKRSRVKRAKFNNFVV